MGIGLANAYDFCHQTLTWNDIDFSKAYVNINKTLTFIKDRKNKSNNAYILQVQDSTKTKAGLRSIPLTKRCLSILKKLKLKNNLKSQLVFPSRNGSLINPRNFQRCFQTICEKARLEKCRCHTLRIHLPQDVLKRAINVKIVSR